MKLRGDPMTLVEKFVKEFEDLPINRQAEVIDFIEFLKNKENKHIEELMDAIITENKDALLELAK